MYIKKIVRKIIRSAGYDIVRYQPEANPTIQSKKLIETFDVDTVIDVGANVGKFGVKLRKLGFQGKIISFEPLSSAFEELQEKAENDSNWEAVNVALGDKNESAEINVSGNSLSSSILDMLPMHEEAAPESHYIGKEKIKVKTLDSIFEDYCSTENNILLKIDTQGFEKKVIEGASESLDAIDEPLTILVLVATVSRVRGPSALTKPFERED